MATPAARIGGFVNMHVKGFGGRGGQASRRGERAKRAFHGLKPHGYHRGVAPRLGNSTGKTFPLIERFGQKGCGAGGSS